MKRLLKWMAILPIVAAMTIIQPSCKKQHLDVLTDTTVNIVSYLRKYPERFSEFIKILDRTNISPFLNAYGTYTLFAPTNDAVATYLKKIGKGSTDELDTATLKSICRLHIIQDTLSTRSFTDGRMATITMYGQYLITGVGTLKDGSAGVLVNRQALITLPNVQTGNGIVHEIDHVLEPAIKTIAQTLEADTRYTIFTQALKATGLYDTLNIANNPDTTRRFLTFLAETDSVLKVAGYSSYAALKTRYNNTGNPKNPSDSLYLYMAYHIVTGANAPRYVADILSTGSVPTIAPQQVVTITFLGTQVLLNQAVFNGVAEAGVLINRTNSDNTASNGVYHNLLGDITIKIRQPYAVYFDVMDQPELRKLASVFRKPSKSVSFAPGQLADVTWPSTNSITYVSNAANSTDFYAWNDYLTFPFRAASTLINYMEFTTPLLVAGKYKVWICYRRGAQGQNVQTSVDGVPLSRILDLSSYLASTAATDPVLEAQGFKRYSTRLGGLGSTSSNFPAQLAGVVDITTTDRHKIRLTLLKESGSVSGTSFFLDMIHFIPIDMDQTAVRIAKDGTWF